MDAIAVQFRRLDMVSGGEGASRPTGVGNNLPVSAHDLMQLVEWAANLPLDSVERRAARASILATRLSCGLASALLCWSRLLFVLYSDEIFIVLAHFSSAWHVLILLSNNVVHYSDHFH